MDSAADPDLDPDVTIVLLGNSGVGKSASGNTVLGRAVFESKASFTSSKVPIREETGEVFGKLVRVIDTPGILELEQPIRACCQEVLQTNRPHLFLLVVKIDRFTLEQKKAVEAAIKVVGDQAFSCCFLLFTYGDTLKNTSLEDFIFKDDQSSLPEVAKRFSDRVHLFNNNDGGREQVRELLEKSGHLEGYRPDPCPGFGSAEGRNHAIGFARGAVGSENRRIILIGPARSGKSSLGNTLLGSRRFETDCDFNGIQKGPECISEEVDGGWVTVVDSAGLSGEGLTLDQLISEMKTLMDLADPGPHVFMIVVKIGRLSSGDARLLRLLSHLLDGDVSRHAAVLFTHSDALGDRSVWDQIRSSSCVSELVSRCGQRLCVVDNTQRHNHQQAGLVLHLINEIIRENKGCYCSWNAFHTLVGTRSRDPGPAVFSRLWTTFCGHPQAIWRTVVQILFLLTADPYRYFY